MCKNFSITETCVDLYRSQCKKRINTRERRLTFNISSLISNPNPMSPIGSWVFGNSYLELTRVTLANNKFQSRSFNSFEQITPKGHSHISQPTD